MEQSPFKLFEPYGSNDKNIFFGRDEEIFALYNLLLQTRLVLVYGASGSGKTSLIHAGLPKIFKATDWYRVSIRRKDNINESFSKELALLTGQEAADDLPAAITALHKTRWIPIYIVFDQFEELFILGNHEERVQFFGNLKQLTDTPLPCKIILSMREEYIGHLYEYEPLLPAVFEKRFRVEPMKDETVRTVITQMCEADDIELAEGKATADQIQLQVKGDNPKQPVHLPYLQVYLHYLYVTALNRQGVARFTQEVLEEVGKLGNVLKRFIETKLETARTHFNEWGLADDFAARLLDEFATDDGTKQSRKATELAGTLEVDKTLVAKALEYFSEGKLLRAEEDDVERYEPVHDVVAKQIFELRSAEDKEYKAFARHLQLAFESFLRDGQPLERLLNDLDLNLAEIYQNRLEKLPNYQKLYYFIKTSREYSAQLKKRQKDRRNLLLGITAAAILSTIIAGWGLLTTRTLLSHFNFQYDRAWAYSDTLNKFALIDNLGNRLTEYVFEDPQKFSENGYALAYGKNYQGGQIIYVVEKSGKVKDTLFMLEPTNNGYFLIENNKGFTCFDSNYNVVKAWNYYEKITGANSNIIEVEGKGNKVGFVNIDGRVVVEPVFEKSYHESGYDFDKGFTEIRKDKKYGLLSDEGKIIVNPEYDGISVYDEFVVVNKDKNYALFDKKGNVLLASEPKEISVSKYFIIIEEKSSQVSPGEFRLLDKHFNLKKNKVIGLLPTNKNDEFIYFIDFGYSGFIDSNATIVNKYKYSIMSDFKGSNNYTFVIEFNTSLKKIGRDNIIKYFKNFYLVDRAGKELRDISVDLHADRPIEYSTSKKYLFFQKNGKRGAINMNNGQTLLRPQFDELEEFQNDTFKFKKNNRWGLVGKNNKIILPAQFDTITDPTDGYARVKRGEKWRYVNAAGKMPFDEYDKVTNYSGGIVFVCDIDDFRKSERNWSILTEDEPKSSYYPGWLENVEEVLALKRNRFAFKKNGKWGIAKVELVAARDTAFNNSPFDIDSKVIVEPKYDDIEILSNDNLGLVRVRKGFSTYLTLDDNGLVIMDLKKYQEGLKRQ